MSSTILQEIIAHKRDEVGERQQARLISAMMREIAALDDLPRGFIQCLIMRVELAENAVIAEIKQASPSKGVIAEHFDPVYAAQRYAECGASCLSVLTDERYFQGHDDYLRQIRAAVELPLLRKDFIIDEYQVVESRLLGADAILLIVAALDDVQLRDYTLTAHDLGMDVLVEVHDADELDRALRLPVHAIGVNNRNLHDFSVDLNTSIELAARLPSDRFLISESGIRSIDDIRRLQEAKIYSYLIGGSLMADADPGAALERLLSGEQDD